ncbi:MAG: class D sortase [Peptococcaceae bacterium]|nr:class D sortase [Peptococcaceae bacterium]
MKLAFSRYRRLIGLIVLLAGLALIVPLTVHIVTLRVEQYRLQQAWRQLQLSTPSSVGMEATATTTSTIATLKAKVKPKPVTISYPAPIMGKLEIPHMGLDDIVLEGTSLNILAYGPGHLQGSAFPGQPGNAIIVAHDDLDFHTLGVLQAGDLIYIKTLQGKTLTFKVEGSKIMGPKDVIALDTKKPTLTLGTCYPFNAYKTTPYRYIVTAKLV